MKILPGTKLLFVALTLAAVSLLTSAARAAYGLINNDAWLRSTDGNPIFAHSAYLTKIGSTYYLYGQEYTGSITKTGQSIRQATQILYQPTSIPPLT